jgi:formate/nitrite transporter FocA (FNT family)
MAEAGAQDSPHLGERQQEQAEQHAPLRPTVIHEIIRAEGEAELEKPLSALLWSGLAAGLSMGFSFLVEALLHGGLPDEPWRTLVASFGYSIGFIIVILGRQQLFTESTLTATLPLLTHPNLSTAWRTVRLWNVVLAANIVGTWLFAAALTYPGLFRPEATASFSELASQAVRGPFWTTLFRAVFAGWLIALMVWLLPSARTARILVITVITYVVALGGLSHIIAGSSEAAYAVLSGQASIWTYVWLFFLPTLIGNTIGGVSLVAMLNHAPLVSELEGGSEKADPG